MIKSQLKVILYFLFPTFILRVCLSYLLLFSKLFPYTPWIIGFNKTELSNIIIYTQNNAKTSDFLEIDQLIPQIESFHDLKFSSKPELFIFEDSLSYIRQSPSKARFCAFPSGRLFITPWAQREAKENKISMTIYLTHELSHILLFQNADIVSLIKFPNWLLEGIAVYSSQQMGTSFYPSKEQTLLEISNGTFMPPTFFKTHHEKEIKLNTQNPITFMYSEFACIVDYLIEKYGKDKFLLYEKSLLKASNHDKVFLKVYGISFNQFIKDFKHYSKVGDQNKG